MSSQSRSGLAAGMLLILVGIAFLIYQLSPGLQDRYAILFSWPIFILGSGLLLLLFSLLGNEPGLAVPASISIGLGGLFYWQNATGNWASWAYVWTLIPGFVGVGILLSGLIGGQFREAVSGGGWLVFISLVMFLIFGSFLGGPNLLGVYWPVLLIGAGMIILFGSLLGRRAA